MPRTRKTPLTGLVAPALAALLAALLLASCGGGEPAEQQETSTSSAPSEQAGQPSEPDGGGAASGDSAGEGSDTDASVEETPDQQGGQTASCPDVVVTPNSGDGLFDVQVEGIPCDEATAALKSWGQAGYPGQAPEGFTCEETSETNAPAAELRCVQEGSGATIRFETGV